MQLCSVKAPCEVWPRAGPHGAFSHAEKLCESGKLRKTMSIDLTPVSGKGAFVRDPLRYGAVAVCEQLRIKTA